MKKGMLMIPNNIQAEQKPWEHGRLQVSDNQRFLQHADGTPFFWLGETAWLMPERLNREEVSYYLDKARDAGYNMIQVQVLNDVPSINAYGQPSHDQQGNLLTKADYGYWDHMDYIVSQAEQRGIYIGMVCIWGGVVKAGKLSVEQAKTYGRFLAKKRLPSALGERFAALPARDLYRPVSSALLRDILFPPSAGF